MYEKKQDTSLISILPRRYKSSATDRARFVTCSSLSISSFFSFLFFFFSPPLSLLDVLPLAWPQPPPAAVFRTLRTAIEVTRMRGDAKTRGRSNERLRKGAGNIRFRPVPRRKWAGRVTELPPGLTTGPESLLQILI